MSLLSEVSKEDLVHLQTELELYFLYGSVDSTAIDILIEELGLFDDADLYSYILKEVNVALRYNK